MWSAGVCVFVRMYVCMYVCMYVYECMYGCIYFFVLSPAPDANLILMLTRRARLGGATAQSPLGVLRYRPLGPFNIFVENDKNSLEIF